MAPTDGTARSAKQSDASGPAYASGPSGTGGQPRVIQAVAGALLTTAVLYVLQGLPFVAWLWWSGSEGEPLFSVIPYWTGAAHLLAVGLFGLCLLTAALVSHAWPVWRYVAVSAVAVALYVATPVVAAAAGSTDPEGTAEYLLVFSLFPLMSGWVAAGCAAVWCWRNRSSQHGRRSAPA
jgi:hypothetical protein